MMPQTVLSLRKRKISQGHYVATVKKLNTCLCSCEYLSRIFYL